MVIIDSCRLHHLIGMLLLGQFKRRIQVDCQLQLSSVIELQQIHADIPRFVIYDLHIELLRGLAQIQAVDASPQSNPLLL